MLYRRASTCYKVYIYGEKLHYRLCSELKRSIMASVWLSFAMLDTQKTKSRDWWWHELWFIEPTLTFLGLRHNCCCCCLACWEALILSTSDLFLRFTLQPKNEILGGKIEKERTDIWWGLLCHLRLSRASMADTFTLPFWQV